MQRLKSLSFVKERLSSKTRSPYRLFLLSSHLVPGYLVVLAYPTRWSTFAMRDCIINNSLHMYCLANKWQSCTLRGFCLRNMKYQTLESSHKSLSTQIAKRQKVAIVMSCTRVLLWQRHDENTMFHQQKNSPCLVVRWVLVPQSFRENLSIR